MSSLLIDATTAQHARGGIGVVVNGLLGAIAERRDTDVRVLVGPHTDPVGLRSWSPPLMARTPARIAFQRLALPAVANLGKRWLGYPDRLVLLDSYVPQWRWPRSHLKVETFVHDVLPLTHPEYFARRKDLAKRLAFHAIQRQRPRVYASCTFTAAEIERELGVTTAIAAFGCGQFTDAEADALLSTPGEDPGDYVLYIGGLEPRKDLGTLVRGFLAANFEGVKLTFVGNMETEDAREFRATAHRLGGDRVRFLGQRNRNEALPLMRRARALVYPSLAEGFGLPVLEGMAASVPVVTTDIPTIRCWAGDGPLYFQAGSPDSMADALRHAVQGRAEVHVARGREIAESFRWRGFAETILAA